MSAITHRRMEEHRSERHRSRMDHSLGVGEKHEKPLYALTHHATEQPHDLPNQRLVLSSDEMQTPEYRGHMTRICNKPCP